MFWVVYISIIVVRIIRVFQSYYEKLKPEEYGCVIGSILISILVTYWLLLTPIFNFFHMKILSRIGYISWNYLQLVLTKIEKFLFRIIKYCLEILISSISLYLYITSWQYIIALVNVDKMTFWIALGILMCYQYIVLRLFSKAIGGIILLLNKKLKKFLCFEKYTKGGIIYRIFKNCTYLSMVLVYAVATDTNKLETPMASAIGVLFLFDTFWGQEKEIQETIECDLKKIEDHI